MLVKRLKLAPDVVLPGGGGEDAGLVTAISAALQVKVLLPPKPWITAAYGAAYLQRKIILETSGGDNERQRK